jgi:hypothetical protein
MEEAPLQRERERERERKREEVNKIINRERGGDLVF